MLKFISGAVCGILAAYAWFTWSPSSYNARVDRLQNFVSTNPISPYGPDTWLMDSALGATFPTGLIFGYADNEELCRDIAQALNVPSCYVPDDSISPRSYPLWCARELLNTVLEEARR